MPLGILATNRIPTSCILKRNAGWGLKQLELVGLGSLRGFARKEEKEAARTQTKGGVGEDKDRDPI